MSGASIELELRDVRMATLATDEGLPILDGGGGRVASAGERELLGVDHTHMDRPTTVLPYTTQSSYDRDPAVHQQRVAVLENEHLRATFLLDLGGRLWTLTDKATGRELLHQPDLIQPGNLALRNAWFAGGAEWNLGVTGHWALTCEPVAAAIVEHDGAQVLRMWAYERMVEIVWQVDVALRAGSPTLDVHVRLHNPHASDRPIYWWSNIAVPQVEGGRVLVDADSAFHFGYAEELDVLPVPVTDGVDISYPSRARSANDYFFNTHSDHPWIAAIDRDGYGLGHSSTSRLTSRKLFVWGVARGGRTWQRWLSGNGAYVEIQAGVARTQLEHLRLPAGQTWSWVESYRPVQADASRAHGKDWAEAVAEGARCTVDPAALDEAKSWMDAASRVPVTGDWGPLRGAPRNQGWGALAVAVGDLPEDPAVPFDAGQLDDEQQAWLELARSGAVADELATSVLTGEGWSQRLREANPGPVQQLLLGYAEHAAGDTDAARELWRSSVAANPTARALRALALTATDQDERADLLVQALEHGGESGAAHHALLVETLTALRAAGRHQQLLTVANALPPAERALPRVAFLEAVALVATGQPEAAKALLQRPLVLPDVREGAASLEELWFDYQKLLGTSEKLPAHYDFRMFVDDEGTTPVPSDQTS